MSVAAARKRKAIELAENGHADVVDSKSLSKAKKTSAAAKSHTSLNRVGVKGMWHFVVCSSEFRSNFSWIFLPS